MIKAVIIASAPGKYKGPDRNKWGHLKLRAVLRQQVEIPRELIPGSKIICQVWSTNYSNYLLHAVLSSEERFALTLLLDVSLLHRCRVLDRWARTLKTG